MAVEELIGPLPNGWVYKTLAEVTLGGGGSIQTGPFGSQLHASDYVPDGVPSIMPKNIGENRVVVDDIARIGPDDAARLSKYLVHAGDIVYSRRGDVEKRALISSSEDGWLCGTGCLRVRFGNAAVDSRYASYYLGHPAVREWIVRHAHGATMPNLNTSILGSLPFAVPPIDDQRRIAHILGTLDDKIELNRRMKETLEEMARALFKSWFVDFDPVRARVEGRDPGLPKHLADLFPDRLVDSGLGEIPDGWAASSVYEIAAVVYGAPFSSKLFNSEGLGTPLIRIRDLRDERPGVWTSGEHSKGYLVDQGDIVVGMDGEFRAYLWAGDRAWLNQRVCVFVPKAPAGAAFVRNAIAGPLAHIEATETATTVIHLGKGDIDRFTVILPDPEVLAAYGQACDRLYARLINSKVEANQLAQLRDVLLERLLDAERDVANT